MGSGDTLPVANGGTGATTLTAHGVLLGNGTGVVGATAEGATGEVLVGVTGGNPVFGKWFHGAVKAADETVTSSTTLQDDADLSFPIGANQTWSVSMNLAVTANASGGFKYDFTLPSGASGWMVVSGNATIATGGVSVTTGAGGTVSLTNPTAILFKVYITSSSTAGTVQFRFAQNASFGTGTTVSKGSILQAIRVS